jgi:enoyl-CoA hydratase
VKTLRTETVNGVRHLVLCRAADYNTITPELRDELAGAIDAADDDRDVHVILLRAEGQAFCAGYGLDWSTAAEAQQVVYDDANKLTAEPGIKLTDEASAQPN